VVFGVFLEQVLFAACGRKLFHYFSQDHLSRLLFAVRWGRLFCCFLSMFHLVQGGLWYLIIASISIGEVIIIGGI